MKRGAALAWSIALHAVVLYGLSRMTWSVVGPAPVRPSVVVWLRNPPRPVKPAKRNAGRAAQQRVATRRPNPGRVKRPARKAGAASPARRQSAAAPGRGANGGKPRGPDLQQLRHRAVAAVLRQRRREQGYMTFSLRDLPERGPATGIPGPKPPKTNVFRYGSQGAQDSGHWLAYNRPARSKLGRWLADTCHALTGGGLGIGIDMFAFADVCAESHAHGDLFESIKPDYLKRDPLRAARPAHLADAAQAFGPQTESAQAFGP